MTDFRKRYRFGITQQMRFPSNRRKCEISDCFYLFAEISKRNHRSITRHLRKKWKDHLLNCVQPNSSFAPYLFTGEDEQATKSVAGEAIFKVLIAHHKVFRTIDLHDNGYEY
ncbi:hypothetical protein CDAR_172661 [Caerostris darwini]|uniref:Uncharacterized protein n=1 Tax=Caerostris darwini TaxID=1538125 RepID=A0AAV4MF53_9ARAC|nr:hypothetical protein CDAR_172661 [Caerostris darwini]